MATVEDKAGKEFWNEQWSGNLVPDAADPSKNGLGNLFTKRMDRLFSDIFRDQATEGKRFLELGCGSSIWLPYFAKRFGFEVSGIDYSPTGVDKERAILAKAGVKGEVVQADFFDPPNQLVEEFDVVYSSGVAEHFEPTERVVTAFADFLKPGGIMVTIVPNLAGLIGSLIRSTNRPLFDIHVPLDCERLRQVHINVGLSVDSCEYFLSTGFGIASVAGLDLTSLSTRVKSLGIGLLEKVSVATWKVEDLTTEAPRTRSLAPYIVCVARKPVKDG